MNDNGWSKHDKRLWRVIVLEMVFLICSLCCLLVYIAANGH